MFRLIVVLFSLSTIFFTACASIKDVECTGIKGFKVNKINAEGINSEVMVTIKNPNSFGFSIYPSEFDVTYGGIKIGKAKLDKKVPIAKNSEETYPFELSGDFKGITLTDIMKLLESFTRKGMLEIKGDLNVGKGLVKKSFPVNEKKTIAID
jgi:LEA14-like dessication related protein